MEAYNAAGTLVDSASIVGASALAPMSVRGFAITHVVIAFTGLAMVLDDLAFFPTLCPQNVDATLGAFVAAGTVLPRCSHLF